MHNLVTFKWLLLIECLFLLSCKQACNSPENTNRDTTIAPAEKDPINANTQPPVAGLSNTDVQYLDLMIPQDAMVEIYYVGDPAELPYIEALKRYLETKHTIITVFKTKSFPQDVTPAGRLYIHDTGDHRYVLYIFNTLK